MYNGWSNYETWRVNLEIFDGYEWEGENYTNTYELSKCLEQYADDAITNFGEITEGLAIDYARSFLSEVNYFEIAEHIEENYPGLVGEWESCDDCGESFKEGTEDYECLIGDSIPFHWQKGYCLACAARNE
jgi:hypothetical protein